MMPSQRIPEPEAMVDDTVEYDQWAQHYLHKVGYSWIRTLLTDGHCPPAPRVLDLGTGTGRLLTTVLEAFPLGEGVGIDLSDTMLEMARAHVQTKPGIKATFCRGNVRALPFETDQFDVVVSFASMHHWQGPLAPVFLDAHRVLKPGGMLVIGDLKRTEQNRLLLNWIPSPSFRKLAEASIYASYTPQELADILAQHPLLSTWRIVENPFAMAVVTPQ